MNPLGQTPTHYPASSTPIPRPPLPMDSALPAGFIPNPQGANLNAFASPPAKDGFTKADSPSKSSASTTLKTPASPEERQAQRAKKKAELAAQREARLAENKIKKAERQAKAEARKAVWEAKKAERQARREAQKAAQLAKLLPIEQSPLRQLNQKLEARLAQLQSDMPKLKQIQATEQFAYRQYRQDSAKRQRLESQRFSLKERVASLWRKVYGHENRIGKHMQIKALKSEARKTRDLLKQNTLWQKKLEKVQAKINRQQQKLAERLGLVPKADKKSSTATHDGKNAGAGHSDKDKAGHTLNESLKQQREAFESRHEGKHKTHHKRSLHERLFLTHDGKIQDRWKLNIFHVILPVAGITYWASHKGSPLHKRSGFFMMTSLVMIALSLVFENARSLGFSDWVTNVFCGSTKRFANHNKHDPQMKVALDKEFLIPA